jgi:hypothetical protein
MCAAPHAAIAFEVVAVGDRAANDDKQHLRQRMRHAPRIARVVDPPDMIPKRPKDATSPKVSLRKAHGGLLSESVRPTESRNPQSVNRP